jgi:recombination associated protein RdgC
MHSIAAATGSAGILRRFFAPGVPIVFKNARLYRLTAPFTHTVAELEEALGGRRFRPCGPIETATLGWTPPLGEDSSALAHAGVGAVLLCARKQERLLPSAAVAEAVDERVAELEGGEAREVGRSERRRIKDQVINEMLPRAFTRSRRTQLYVDTQAGWLVVDAGSDKQAEEVISLLRETLGSLPVRPPEPGMPATSVLTGWVLPDGAPADFIPADACELRDPQDKGAVIRASGQDLGSDEIQNHLRAGKQVVKLALDWQERLTCVLTDDLALKRLRLADALFEDLDDGEDPAARLDAEFAIMAGELRGLIARLAELFDLDTEGRPSA